MSVAVRFARNELQLQPHAAISKRPHSPPRENMQPTKRRRVQDEPPPAKDIDIDRTGTPPNFPELETQAFVEDLQEGTSNALGNEPATSLLPSAPPRPRRSARVAENTEQIIERRWGNNPQSSDDSNPSDDSMSDTTLPDADDVVDPTHQAEDDEEDFYEEDVAEAPVDINRISPWDRLGEDFQREVAALGMSPSSKLFSCANDVYYRPKNVGSRRESRPQVHFKG